LTSDLALCARWVISTGGVEQLPLSFTLQAIGPRSRRNSDFSTFSPLGQQKGGTTVLTERLITLAERPVGLLRRGTLGKPLNFPLASPVADGTLNPPNIK